MLSVLGYDPLLLFLVTDVFKNATKCVASEDDSQPQISSEVKFSTLLNLFQYLENKYCVGKL